MCLTAFTDYTLRVLIYLGVHDAELSTIGKIANAYSISENHLIKVVHFVSVQGYLETSRGKGGGIRLACAADAINIGDVVRTREGNLRLVECFDPRGSECQIEPAWTLKGAFVKAVEAFFASLDSYTLAELLGNRKRLAKMLPQPG